MCGELYDDDMETPELQMFQTCRKSLMVISLSLSLSMRMSLRMRQMQEFAYFRGCDYSDDVEDQQHGSLIGGTEHMITSTTHGEEFENWWTPHSATRGEDCNIDECNSTSYRNGFIWQLSVSFR